MNGISILNIGLMTPAEGLINSEDTFIKNEADLPDTQPHAISVITRSSTKTLIKEFMLDDFEKKDITRSNSREKNRDKKRLIFQDFNERYTQRKRQTQSLLQTANYIESIVSAKHPMKIGNFRKVIGKSTFFSTKPQIDQLDNPFQGENVDQKLTNLEQK